jgi:hypothetical protein
MVFEDEEGASTRRGYAAVRSVGQQVVVKIKGQLPALSKEPAIRGRTGPRRPRGV